MCLFSVRAMRATRKRIAQLANFQLAYTAIERYRVPKPDSFIVSCRKCHINVNSDDIWVDSYFPLPVINQWLNKIMIHEFYFSHFLKNKKFIELFNIKIYSDAIFFVNISYHVKKSLQYIVYYLLICYMLYRVYLKWCTKL